MKRNLLVFNLIALLALAACSPSAQVRPISEVTADQPPEITNIGPQDATLLFESSIPLACSVVYGETTDYGMISTDTDMAGGAHSDHSPLLTGLKPDTTYHFRVQGAAADGTLYRSEDMTFRTPPRPDSAEINYASLEQGAAIVDVSSNFGGAANDEQWGANGAIDGNRGSAWSSDGDGDDAFIEIELAQPIQLQAVEVWSRSMADGTARVESFTLTTDRGETLGPFELDDPEVSQRFEVDAPAERLRFEVVESSGGNVGLVEFAAYGEQLER
ncbi:MAG: discoidin domain-containing protein [Anaerolineales bacterium]|nr:discoidin domain-containing protein [Anaerolineales bacterium]